MFKFMLTKVKKDEHGTVFSFMTVLNEQHERLINQVFQKTDGLTMFFLSHFTEQQLFNYNYRLGIKAAIEKEDSNNA